MLPFVTIQRIANAPNCNAASVGLRHGKYRCTTSGGCRFCNDRNEVKKWNVDSAWLGAEQ